MAVCACALATGAAPALAAPDCPGGPVTSRTLLSGQGTLESVITDARGPSVLHERGQPPPSRRAWGQPVSSGRGGRAGGPGVRRRRQADRRLRQQRRQRLGWRRDRPSRSPARRSRYRGAGGLRDRPVDGQRTGPRRPTAASTRATTSAPTSIASATARPSAGWATVESGNGLVVDSGGRYLYVAQTFRPAAIQRIDLQDPVARHRVRDRRRRATSPPGSTA